MSTLLPTAWTRRAQARETARGAGATAACYGLSRDVNPYGEGSELWRSWNRGWRENADTQRIEVTLNSTPNNDNAFYELWQRRTT